MIRRPLDLYKIFHKKLQKVFCFIGPALGLSADPILWTTHTEACIHDHELPVAVLPMLCDISTPVSPRPKLTNLQGS